jgi:hypothetical protein
MSRRKSPATAIVAARIAATFLGPAIIQETVVLSPSGKSFEGTFTIDPYATDEITLIEHISGTVTATRFTVN